MQRSEGLKLLRLEREYELRRARESMLAFTEFTMPAYRTNWHHRVLCSYLDRFVAGEIRNLMVFMPPRHGKSELVSRRLPAFLLGKKPGVQIIAASYSADLASMMNRDVQRIMDSQEYAWAFPETRLNASNIRTTAQGQYLRNSDVFEVVGSRSFYRSAGVGGGITGMGANYAIIDDPIKNQEEANSETMRENVWGWYTSTLYTRLQNPRSVLLTLTRWHEDDLAGRLLQLAKQDPKADQWTVLKLPARCEFHDKHPDDPRAVGEALWEEDFGEKVLTSIQSSVGPIVWSALYQQSPSPAAGGFFESGMFEFKKLTLPADGSCPFRYTFATGDTSYKESQENDYTVMASWGWDGNNLWLIDVYRARIKAADSEKPVVAFLGNNTKWNFRGAYIEPKGHGIYFNQVLPRRGVIMPSENKIKEFFSDRRLDKKERASNVIPNLSNKKVFINEEIHIREELLAEVLAFPKGKHDDFVDCLVDALKMVYPNTAPGIIGALMQGRG